MYKSRKRIYTLGLVRSWRKGEKTPILKMTGQWLMENGFKIGDQFQVIESNDQLILRKI